MARYLHLYWDYPDIKSDGGSPTRHEPLMVNDVSGFASDEIVDLTIQGCYCKLCTVDVPMLGLPQPISECREENQDV